MKRFLLLTTLLLAGGFGPTVLKAAPVAESGDTNIVSHTFTGLTASPDADSPSLQSNQAVAPLRSSTLTTGHAPTLWTTPQLVVQSVQTGSDTVFTGTQDTGLIRVHNVGDSTARVDTAAFRYVHETDGTVNSFYTDTPTQTPDVPAHASDTILLDVRVDSDADTGSVVLSSSVQAQGPYTGVDASIQDRSETGVWTVASGRAILSYTTDTDALIGSTRPGDTIEYTLSVQNDGGNNAKNTTIYGVLPEETTYVPDSLETNNTLTGSTMVETAYDADTTDPFDGADNESVVRLYSVIDTIAPGQTVQITFRVVVD